MARRVGSRFRPEPNVDYEALDTAMKAYFDAEYRFGRAAYQGSGYSLRDGNTAVPQEQLNQLREAALRLMPPDESWFSGPQGALNKIRDSAQNFGKQDVRAYPPVSVDDGLRGRLPDYQRVSQQAIASFTDARVPVALERHRTEAAPPATLPTATPAVVNAPVPALTPAVANGAVPVRARIPHTQPPAGAAHPDEVKSVQRLLGDVNPSGRLDDATRERIRGIVRGSNPGEPPTKDKDLLRVFNDVVLNSSEAQKAVSSSGITVSTGLTSVPPAILVRSTGREGR